MNRTEHGYCHHPLYSKWDHIKSRCYNKKDNRYKDYGGRGISMCDEWREDPKAFIEWALANEWKKKLYIDRIDNDGDYEPVNCRFVSIGSSNRNERLLRSTNTSGYRGVSWDSKRGKWISKITINSKIKYLGQFTSPVLANASSIIDE